MHQKEQVTLFSIVTLYISAFYDSITENIEKTFSGGKNFRVMGGEKLSIVNYSHHQSSEEAEDEAGDNCTNEHSQIKLDCESENEQKDKCRKLERVYHRECLRKLIKIFIDFLIVTRKAFFSVCFRFCLRKHSTVAEKSSTGCFLFVFALFIAVLALSTSPSIFMKNAFFQQLFCPFCFAYKANVCVARGKLKKQNN